MKTTQEQRDKTRAELGRYKVNEVIGSESGEYVLALLADASTAAQLEAERDEARALLGRAAPWVEHGLPPAPKHHCGPESGGCDGECVDYARGCELLSEISTALGIRLLPALMAEIGAHQSQLAAHASEAVMLREQLSAAREREEALHGKFDEVDKRAGQMEAVLELSRVAIKLMRGLYGDRIVCGSSLYKILGKYDEARAALGAS